MLQLKVYCKIVMLLLKLKDWQLAYCFAHIEFAIKDSSAMYIKQQNCLKLSRPKNSFSAFYLSTIKLTLKFAANLFSELIIILISTCYLF